MSIKKVFKKEKNILIGMIHLPPLLSMQGFPGMKKIIEKALDDLRNLERAGFDAALIENNNDKPHAEFANAAQIASLTSVTNILCKQASIPVGVQMMLNDWQASFVIAKVTGAQFTRLDVFVDHVTCEWCQINPNPRDIIKFKNKIYPDLLLLTDIQVKHKKMLKPRPLVSSAKLAIKEGSNGLVITGLATGMETPIQKIKNIRNKFPKFPIFVGAGINEKNIKEQLSLVNGVIVGTSIKKDNKIDLEKAKGLVSIIQE